jgi:hypothetical protein
MLSFNIEILLNTVLLFGEDVLALKRLKYKNVI